MTSRATVLAATGLGFVAGFLGGTLSGSRPDFVPAPQARTAELRPRVELLKSNGLDPAWPGGKLAAMSERLSAQDRRILTLEAKLAAAMERADTRARLTAPERDKERGRLEALKTARVREPRIDAAGAGPRGPGGLSGSGTQVPAPKAHMVRYYFRQPPRPYRGRSVRGTPGSAGAYANRARKLYRSENESVPVQRPGSPSGLRERDGDRVGHHDPCGDRSDPSARAEDGEGRPLGSRRSRSTASPAMSPIRTVASQRSTRRP